MMWVIAAFDALAAIAGFTFIICAIRSWNATTRELKSKYPWLF